jgi:hypothetical protein
MKLRSKLRVLAITVGVVGAVAALGASPAMAEKIATKFNASTAKLSGTNLTVKKNGGEAKTCELKPVTGKASEPNGILEVWTVPLNFALSTILECTGGTKFSLTMIAYGKYETTTGAYSLKLTWSGGGHGYVSPYGSYIGGYNGKEVSAGWTNGSGLTPSTINFNETWLGVLESDFVSNITLTGTITATTSTGGLLTLSH